MNIDKAVQKAQKATAQAGEFFPEKGKARKQYEKAEYWINSMEPTDTPGQLRLRLRSARLYLNRALAAEKPNVSTVIYTVGAIQAIDKATKRVPHQ